MFQPAISIKTAVTEIHNRRYLLPSIQREFVWTEYKIIRLFDSIMRGYPISSFLFWKIHNANKNKFTLYEFVKDYHERDNKHNKKANLKTATGDITAILDGQQRLASMYIALMGSYSARISGGWWSQASSFPKKNLYLNLMQKLDDEELIYDFKFLKQYEAERKDENQFWFKVGDILNFKEPSEVNNFIVENNLYASKFPSQLLFNFYLAIHSKPVINFYLEESEELDKVLNIFIRINSGGTQLSYSDMLLSIATGQWETKDAREEINDLVDELQRKDFWGVSKDWVLKACLYLADIKDIKFKVDNFKKENMLKIEVEWEKIKESLHNAIDLIATFGYASEKKNIPSYNAILPIAFYLHKFQQEDNFIQASKHSAKRKEIHNWLIQVILKQTFSGQPDNVLIPFRNSINKIKDFSLEDLKDSVRLTNKNIAFYEDDIDGIIYTNYKKEAIYSILCLLYPTFDFKNNFHIDHIFPRKYHSEKEFCDYLPNLQLLDEQDNLEKNSTPFKEWLFAKYPDTTERKEYMKKHYIPDCDLENFDEFIQQRTELLKNKLKTILQIVPTKVEQTA